MEPYPILQNVAFDIHMNLLKVVQGGLSRRDLHKTREILVRYSRTGDKRQKSRHGEKGTLYMVNITENPYQRALVTVQTCCFHQRDCCHVFSVINQHDIPRTTNKEKHTI